MVCKISCDELSENYSMEINHSLMTSILFRISDIVLRGLYLELRQSNVT